MEKGDGSLNNPGVDHPFEFRLFALTQPPGPLKFTALPVPVLIDALLRSEFLFFIVLVRCRFNTLTTLYRCTLRRGM
jgi:hypothetical protein